MTSTTLSSGIFSLPTAKTPPTTPRRDVAVWPRFFVPSCPSTHQQRPGLVPSSPRQQSFRQLRPITSSSSSVAGQAHPTPPSSRYVSPPLLPVSFKVKEKTRALRSGFPITPRTMGYPDSDVWRPCNADGFSVFRCIPPEGISLQVTPWQQGLEPLTSTSPSAASQGQGISGRCYPIDLLQRDRWRLSRPGARYVGRGR